MIGSRNGGIASAPARASYDPRSQPGSAPKRDCTKTRMGRTPGTRAKVWRRRNLATPMDRGEEPVSTPSSPLKQADRAARREAHPPQVACYKVLNSKRGAGVTRCTGDETVGGLRCAPFARPLTGTFHERIYSPSFAPRSPAHAGNYCGFPSALLLSPVFRIWNPGISKACS
jgi:hypothetical protein